jgi:hypothetical protein
MGRAWSAFSEERDVESTLLWVRQSWTHLIEDVSQ